MSARPIDIYEKYINLFPIRINPPLDALLPIQQEEISKFPISIKNNKDNNYLAIAETKELMNYVPSSVEAGKVIRTIFCDSIKRNKNLILTHFGTQFADVTKPLKTYFDKQGNKIAIVYPSFSFRIWEIEGMFYLCLDWNLAVRNLLSIDSLSKAGLMDVKQLQYAEFKTDKDTSFGHIISSDTSGTQLETETKEIVKVSNDSVYPSLPSKDICFILSRLGLTNIDRDIKELSLLLVDQPARQRFERICNVAKVISERVFPIKIGPYLLELDSAPAKLLAPTFTVIEDIKEADAIFDREDLSKTSKKILDGLTSYGTYEKPKQDINVVLLSCNSVKNKLEALISAIKDGYRNPKYKGLGSTFGVNLKIVENIETISCNEYLDACKKFVKGSNFEKTNIFIIYVPESIGKASYDSPYFVIKKYLIENGIPSQVVDEETLNKPQWKDLNLGLDIFAKCGYVPWVLADEMPDVDLFIGLSWSQITDNLGTNRIMSYVNVFDKFGRWRFYHGDAEACDYQDRHTHYNNLIIDSINKFQGINASNKIDKIHIHYNQKFSKQDRLILYKSIRNILPKAIVYFTSINTQNTFRLFDLADEGGFISRGTYVKFSDNQFLISTTGRNAFGQKGLGTPKILHIINHILPEDTSVDLGNIAKHILNLTRLNWASSSSSFCHEPVTIKFAREIAYFMSVFMRDRGFRLNERIKNKPWFL